MKKRDVFYRLPLYLLWALIAIALVQFIFQRVSDTGREKKLTLMIEAPQVETVSLMRRFSRDLPEGIDMLKARAFSYAMFLESSLKEADIWIVKASSIEKYLPDFGPVPGFRETHPDLPYWTSADGSIWGIRVYEAAGGKGCLTEYVSYSDEATPAEDYYLFFNPASPHVGAQDQAAFWLAEEIFKTRDLSIDIRPVADIPADFIFGMDASIVPSLEAGGVKFYNAWGQEEDVFRILADNGFTMIRVRVWHDPFDEEGRGYGGGNCDMQLALEIGKRAARWGLSLCVDFHYSDFWADPGKQQVPKAWESMNPEEKSRALYEYTRDSLKQLKAAGIPVALVQLGNETNGAMAGEKSWETVCRLMQAGSRAVREVFPQARVAVHFTNPEKAGAYLSYASYLKTYGVDYDVFGTSYYPLWHGSLDNLAQVLSRVSREYQKKTLVLETAYPYTLADSDFYGNLISQGTQNTASPYPFTLQGQADFLTDLTDYLLHKSENCLGLFYWEGCWISAGGRNYAENAALWESWGSGWASSFAASYDPQDAGRYYGGCAVDNQALFDARGKPLETLGIFRRLRE